MQYKCIKRIKGSFTFGKGHKVNDIIRPDQYNKLSDEDKACFIEDYSDETWKQQMERNRERDEKADKE